tara:strand:- start:1043 stop:1486 length:444 start_codon:yes stop_codon:yes gene_type:complete
MADKKVTQLTALTSPNDEDLLLMVDDPNGTPVSKSITVKTFLGALPSNTAITGDLTVTANGSFTGSNVNFTSNVVVTGTATITQAVVASDRLTIKTTKTPSNNNATTQLGTPVTDRPHDGTLFWDSNYLYVAVSNTVVKRVALSVFS